MGTECKIQCFGIRPGSEVTETRNSQGKCKPRGGKPFSGVTSYMGRKGGSFLWLDSSLDIYKLSHRAPLGSTSHHPPHIGGETLLGTHREEEEPSVALDTSYLSLPTSVPAKEKKKLALLPSAHPPTSQQMSHGRC